MRTKRGLLVAVLAAAAAIAVGCGGDDDGNGAAETGSGGDASPVETSIAETASVGMKNIAFEPQKITVEVGETITWTNNESIPHDVKATSGADFESDTFGENGTFKYTPRAAGTIEYECTLHPGMEGSIEVTG